MEPSVNPDQLKEIIKTALVEVLEQRRDLLHDAVAEALEEVEEGAGSELIGRTEVFDLLEGKA